MFHSAAAIARCSKVVRRVRKTKAAAQILPQCVNCITCILHIRCLIIYCIKLPRCGYVLLSIKYTCKHHLKWVRRTKKIPWRNYPILAVNLHWLAKSCSISVCLQAVPTYFDGVNSNLKPSTPKPTLVSLNHGHIHQPSGAQVLACSHIRKKCWHHQLSQDSWATSTKAVGDAKHTFFPPVH